MFTKVYHLESQLTVYGGQAAWHFLTVPQTESAEINRNSNSASRGWGSVFVKVTINQTSWETSLFPNKKDSTYLLPVKKSIRDLENIKVGDKLNFTLEVSL